MAFETRFRRSGKGTERLIHGFYVLRRYVRLDVVHLTEHKSAAMREIIHPAYHLVLYVLHSPVRKHLLRIAASSPEGELLPELPLQLRGVHASCRHLYRVQGIDTAFGDIRNELIHGPARVK
jgi:hypothetical protein